MKRIKLHLIACVLFMPVMLLFCGSLLCVLFCVVYCYMLQKLCRTESGSRFIRCYYHEILRLENML